MIRNLTPGKKFKDDASKQTITIVSNDYGHCAFDITYKGKTERGAIHEMMLIEALNTGLWTEVFNSDLIASYLGDASCKHKNKRQDRFFSARVYNTCKDCGKPLD